MAVTLVDYYKQSKDPLTRGFIADLLRYSEIIGAIPFESIPGLQVTGTRWQTLSTAAFRAIGAGYTEGTGTTEQVEETLSVLGGDVKIDRVLNETTNNFQDPLTTQMQMKAKAVAFAFNNYFINGDAAVDPDGFEGLKKRVSNMPTRMTIKLDSAGDGTGTSLKVLASTANENSFLDALHQARKYVGGATHMFCNETTWLGFGKVARRLNLYQQITDALDRTWNQFDGVTLMDVGLKGDKSTEIITTSEPTSAASDGTSIYVVRIDTEDGLHGLQLNGKSPAPYDPLTGGELESGPQLLRRIDWPVGLYNLSNYCICRIQGFKMAAS